MTMSLLIVGLDGASFNLVGPWLKQGELPHLQHILDSGVSGDLESCLPPVTMPAWRVFSTGKYPGKLGVFWHQQLDLQTHQVITPDATYFPGADYWDYLNQAGFRTGIVGMPDTYPPRVVEGFLVAGGPTAGPAEYAYPAGLAREIEDQVGFQPTMKGDISLAEGNSALVQEALDVVNSTFAAAEYLAGKYPVDVLQITTFEINRLHHFFYDGPPSLQAWQIVDGWLGKLRPNFDYVVILSDHGTERLKRAYFLNVWLRHNGYLVTHLHPLDILPRLGINRTSIGAVMQKLGLVKLFSYETLIKYASMLPRSTGVFGEIGNQEVVKRVDWARTRAFALAQGPLYINRDLVRDADEYERLRSELISGLEALADPETGEPIIKKVYRREEIYHGPYAEQAPDLLVLDQDPYHNRAGLAQAHVFPGSWRWKGNNRHQGLFAIAGPGIKSGQKLEAVRIVDLAPTILHLAGVPVPDDMDGRVLQEGLAADAAPIQRPVQSQPPLDSDRKPTHDGDYEEIVADRLRALGYL
jgi:predicted AlkP superfamily phosphohydrolase/phosphomutase